MQLRLMCQFHVPVVVKVLPPYIPSQQEKADPRLFSSNVARLFSEELQLPIVNQVVFSLFTCKDPTQIPSYGQKCSAAMQKRHCYSYVQCYAWNAARGIDHGRA